MTRLRRYAYMLFLLPALMGLPASLSAAQWLYLQPARSEAILRFDGIFRSTEDSEDTDDTDLEAGFRVSRSGYALDPAIASFYLQLEPYFSQGKSTGTAFSEDRDGNFFNYNGRLSLFQGTPGPFALVLSAGRVNGTNDGSLGNRTEYDVVSRLAELRWKYIAFPMFLKYEERILEQFFRSGLSSITSDRDEIMKSLSVAGRSSKMSIRYERQWLDDRSILHDNDYVTHQGRFDHRLGWNRRSSLKTEISLLDRTGFNAYRQLNMVESATIHHTDTLDSTTTYRHGSVTRDEKSTSDQVEFGLRHRLYQNLTTTARVAGASIQSDILDEEQARVGLDFDYRKKELFGAAVNARIGTSYREIDRVSKAGLNDIVNEAHSVPLAGDVILGERFIVATSIIVTDPAGTQVFTEGLDYEIFPAGGDLTQLLTIPGGQINVGDTVLISYQAENLPTLKYSTTLTDIYIRMDWDWVAISHRDNRSDDQRISGAAESFLNDRRNTTTDIEFRWDRNNFKARFGAERRFIRTGDFRTTTYTARQSLSYKPSRLLSMDLTISEIFTRSDTHDIDMYNLQYSVTWRPSARFSIRPRIGAWKRVDEGSVIVGNRRDDNFFSAGFDLRLNYRKITLDFRYFHNRRGTDSIDTDEDRVMFTLKRRF